jgi:hypothetical protein
MSPSTAPSKPVSTTISAPRRVIREATTSGICGIAQKCAKTNIDRLGAHSGTDLSFLIIINIKSLRYIFNVND